MASFGCDIDWSSKKDMLKEFGSYVGKKGDVFILSSGPTHTQFDRYKDKFDWSDTYLIAVKSMVSFLQKKGTDPDFMITNFAFSHWDISEKVNTDVTKSLCVYKQETLPGSCEELQEEKFFHQSQCNVAVELDWKKDVMKCVEDGGSSCFSLTSEKNHLVTGWGHVMCELAIPLALYLKPRNIYVLGWDQENEKGQIEKFGIYQDSVKIAKWAKHLGPYLDKEYGVKIFKLSSDQAVDLPLAQK